MSFVKLKDLDGKEFTVENAQKFQWKKWDSTASKMLTSEKWEQGFNKRFPVDTKEGLLELSEKQMSDMLVSVCVDGKSDIVGKTYKVKRHESQGQQGVRITYYINPVWDNDKRDTPKWDSQKEAMEQKASDKAVAKELDQKGLDVAPDFMSDEPVDLSEIPF